MIILCLLQMLERYAFYVVNIFLSLYCIASVSSGGLGWSKEEAVLFFGNYYALVYLSPLAGGLISDLSLGKRKSVFAGLAFYLFGYLLLADYLKTGLFLIAIGYGLFKPCVLNLIDELYPNKEDARKEQAFSFFYTSTTLGVFLASLIGGWLHTQYTFKLLFLSTAVTIFSAVIVYSIFCRIHSPVPSVSTKKSKESTAADINSEKAVSLSTAIYLLAIASLSVIFYLTHQSGGNLITIYIQEHVNRYIAGYEFPSGWILAIAVSLTSLLSFFAGILWKYLDDKGYKIQAIDKMCLGFFTTAIAFACVIPPALFTQNNPSLQSGFSWFIGFNLAFSLSKVLVNPTLWSVFNRLSPAKYQSLCMGASFLCMSLGNFLGGKICGTCLDKLNYSGIMFLFSVMMLVATCIVLILRHIIRRNRVMD